MRPNASAISFFRAMTILVGGLLYTAAFAQNSPCTTEAQTFWKEFRCAVLLEEHSRVAELSNFPFRVRGGLDDDAVKELGREQFLRIIPKLLETDAGVSAEVVSMRRLIKNTTELLGSFCNPHKNQFRVGVWVFSRTSESWLFTQAFVDD
jgi:hypothetical protein